MRFPEMVCTCGEVIGYMIQPTFRRHRRQPLQRKWEHVDVLAPRHQDGTDPRPERRFVRDVERGIKLLDRASSHVDRQLRCDEYYRSLADASNLIDDLRDKLLAAVAI